MLTEGLTQVQQISTKLIVLALNQLDTFGLCLGSWLASIMRNGVQSVLFQTIALL
jgi:hypothetical protein